MGAAAPEPRRFLLLVPRATLFFGCSKSSSSLLLPSSLFSTGWSFLPSICEILRSPGSL